MNARFDGPLVIEEIGYELWRLARSFRYLSAEGVDFRVPVGFVTDMASVPILARGLVSKIGYWSQPAVVHDYIYRLHRTGIDKSRTRKEADQILLEGMILKEKEYDVPSYLHRAKVIYAACRMGGLATWETPEERRERFARVDGVWDDE